MMSGSGCRACLAIRLLYRSLRQQSDVVWIGAWIQGSSSPVGQCQERVDHGHEGEEGNLCVLSTSSGELNQ